MSAAEQTIEERIREAMEAMGHGPLVEDGPGFHRVTCQTCRRAGLNAGGPDYGSALVIRCEDTP